MEENETEKIHNSKFSGKNLLIVLKRPFERFELGQSRNFSRSFLFI